MMGFMENDLNHGCNGPIRSPFEAVKGDDWTRFRDRKIHTFTVVRAAPLDDIADTRAFVVCDNCRRLAGPLTVLWIWWRNRHTPYSIG